MAMQYLRDGATSGFLKIILIGFLVAAVGGLVLMDVGGFFRGGITNTDVIKVGSQKIGIQEFDLSIRRRAAEMNLTPQQVYQFGFVQDIIGGEISRTMMEQLAHKNGIELGRDYIANQIMEMIQPYIEEGQDPQDTLEQLLRNQGMSEGQFIRSMQSDVARQTLAQGLQAGFSVISDQMVKDLYKIENQSRTFEFLNLPQDQITLDEEPSQEDLQSLYSETKNSYAIPESRDIRVLQLDLDNIANIAVISEDEVAAYYEENIGDYEEPEKRSISQAQIQSEDLAKQIYDRVQNGEEFRFAVVDTTGSEDTYRERSSFSRETLIPELQTSVFEASDNSILEPIQTPFGWQIVYVHATERPFTRAFNDVRQGIEQQLKKEREEDARYELISALDDMLLDEMSFEDIRKELNITIQSIQGIRQFENTNSDILSSYEEDDQNIIAEKTFELLENEQSDILELKNGEIISLHLEKITPRAFRSFEEVQEAVLSEWNNQTITKNNRSRALDFKRQLENGDITLSQVADQNGLAMQIIDNLNADKELPTPILERSSQIIFNILPETYALVETQNGIGIVYITDVQYPSPSDDELKSFRTELIQKQRNEAITLYLNSKRDDFKPKVNQALLNQLYGQEASY